MCIPLGISPELMHKTLMAMAVALTTLAKFRKQILRKMTYPENRQFEVVWKSQWVNLDCFLKYINRTLPCFLLYLLLFKYTIHRLFNQTINISCTNYGYFSIQDFFNVFVSQMFAAKMLYLADHVLPAQNQYQNVKNDLNEIILLAEHQLVFIDKM